MKENEIKEKNKVVYLLNNDILPNRFQPRKYFDEEEIMQLSESIKEHGVINPIIVRKLGDKYELVAGERRYKANILAGNDDIPAIIMDVNDKESSEIAVVENIQRKDLNAIEEAISYKRILDIGYMTQDQLAQKMGKSQSSIANKIRLLKLSDEVQDALMKKQISERHARSLLKLESQKKQNELLERIINERLTVRKTDEEIEKMNNNMSNFNNIYNNTPDSIAPIMPNNNVTDVNISGNQQNIPAQNSNIVEPNITMANNSFVEPMNQPVNMTNEASSIENKVSNVNPSTDLNNQNFQQQSNILNDTNQTVSIPTLSIDDVLAKANQPSVVGNTVNNEKTNSNNNLGNNFDMPNFSPINEEPTSIETTLSNAQKTIGIEENTLVENQNQPISPLNNEIQNNNVQSQNLMVENQNTVNSNSVNQMPDLNPINEEPFQAEDLLNSQMPEVQNNTTNTDFNVFSPFNVGNEKKLDLPIDTSPIIDTTNTVNLNADTTNTTSNINNLNVNELPTIEEMPISQKFENVPEPIIVNEYNDQYDPIMPQTQNQQPTIDFKAIINLIRKCSQAIENSGYKIETEEYNLDNLYQVVFKIDKQ